MTEFLEFIKKGLESSEDSISLTKKISMYSTDDGMGFPQNPQSRSRSDASPSSGEISSATININYNYAPPTVSSDVTQSHDPKPESASESRALQERYPQTEVHSPADSMKALRQETANMNTFSGFYEAQGRLSRHQEKQHDDAQLNFIRQELSCLPILELRKHPEVQADFPLSHLPLQAADFVSSMSAATGLSQHLLGPGLIGAIWAAASGRFYVRDRDGHTEGINGFILGSFPSGSGKSEGVKHLRSPFDKVQAELLYEFASKTPEATNHARRAVIKKLEAELKRKTNLAFRDGLTPDAMAETLRADCEQIENLKLSLTKRQNEPKLLLDRVTMSQLPFEMAAQNGVAAIIDAEAAVLQQIRPNNDSILLKGFTGELFSSATRKDVVVIEKPCLTLYLLGQPDKLQDFYGNEKFVSHGLAARFLPVFGSSNERINATNFTAPPSQATDWYETIIRALLACTSQKEGGREAVYLDLTPDAASVLTNYRRKVKEEQKIGHYDNCEAFSDRLPAHACRLAGALGLMAAPAAHEGIVDEGAMRGGVALAEYFTLHALTAFSPSAWNALKFAPRILHCIRDEHCDTFKGRDAQRWIGSGRHNINVAKAALDELERCNIVRSYITTTRSVVYVVHPRILTRF